MTEEPGRFRVGVVGEDGEDVGEFVVRDRSGECRAAVDHLLPGIDAVESVEQCPVLAGAQFDQGGIELGSTARTQHSHRGVDTTDPGMDFGVVGDVYHPHHRDDRVAAQSAGHAVAVSPFEGLRQRRLDRVGQVESARIRRSSPNQRAISGESATQSTQASSET